MRTTLTALCSCVEDLRPPHLGSAAGRDRRQTAAYGVGLQICVRCCIATLSQRTSAGCKGHVAGPRAPISCFDMLNSNAATSLSTACQAATSPQHAKGCKEHLFS